MGAGDPRQAALQSLYGVRAGYCPRGPPLLGSAHRVVDGSLLLSPASLRSPRLARRGQEGAEELSNLLDNVFSQLLVDAEDEGADLLKWGGDALLLLFDGPDHGRRAARAGLRCTGLLHSSDAPKHLSAESSCVLPRVSSLVQST